jgi:hypothetical protein
MADTNAVAEDVSVRRQKSQGLTPVFPYQFVGTRRFSSSLQFCTKMIRVIAA